MNTIPTSTPTDVAEPLATIGLALSGGGFRAASFSLGCLAYLNHCTIGGTDGQPTETLLNRVRFISSASGGSLPNLLYATYRYSGQAFQTCYRTLRQFMNGDTLFRQVFNTLESDEAWKSAPSKQRNLINAFSLAYQELFENALEAKPGQSATLGLFKVAPNQPRICVNSTEFQNGLTFRFQNPDGNGQVGNFGLFLAQAEVSGKLRLGDIMAASSCFPSGLEPIMFPRDFVHGHAGQPGALTEVELSAALVPTNPMKKARQIRDSSPASPLRPTTQEQLELYDKTKKPTAKLSQNTLEFGLMDGGIDDNQGLGSLLLADERKDDGNRFGTLIACDVSSPYMTPFAVPQAKTGFFRNLSLRFWGWAMATLGGVLLGVGLRWGGPTVGPVLATLGTLVLLIDAAINVTIWKGLGSLAKSGTWGWVAHQYVGYFFTVPLSSLGQMLSARLKSTVILASDVYMKQIRRMHYDEFYNNELYKNRQVTCLIYSLAKTTYTGTGNNPQDAACLRQYDLVPSEAMKQIADSAMHMDTTLWFSPDEMKQNLPDQLIATGQFTLCFNLLRYLCRVEATGSLSPALQKLREQMLADWKHFQQNPNWLMERLND